MTQTAPEATAAAQNGQPAPSPGGEDVPCGDCVPVSERLMGIFGLLFAAALGVIALDLLTGGWVTGTAARITGGGGSVGAGSE